ncbi:MAG: AAA family ATPase [Patescibacteria group bacterium]
MSNDSRIANIPQVLPLYGAEPDGRIIFPGMPVRMMHCHNLPEQPFCVVVSYWSGVPTSNCGVIGEIVCIERDGEKRFYFHGIVRVYFYIENRDGENIRVRWILFYETDDLAENRSERKQLNKRILQLRAISKRFISFLLEQREEKTKEFLKDEFVVRAIQIILNVQQESLMTACDNIMNIANALHIPNVDIMHTHFFSQAILAEKFWHTRLFLVQEYMRGVLGDKKNSVIANIPISDGKANEKQTSPSIQVSGRKAIVDSLAVREIPLRDRPAVLAPEPLCDAIILDHRRESAFMKNGRAFFSQYIVNQDRAQKQIIGSLVFMKYRSPNSPEAERPIIGGMFLGPTGVGKTELVKTLTKFLLNDPRGYTHVPCSMLQIDHEKSHLIGSPPGYIGYDDIPLFSQWRLDRAHVVSRLRKLPENNFQEIYQKLKELESMLHEVKAEHRPAVYEKIQKLTGWIPGDNISIVLFDEIEKASVFVYQVLLKVFDDGCFPLLNGETTIFKNTIFCFTSNLYATKLMEEMTGRGRIGIHAENSYDSVQKKFKNRLYKEVLAEVEKHFRVCPEFFARVGKEHMVVCYPLEEEHYTKILDLRIDEYETNLMIEYGLGRFFVSDAARNFFIQEALDPLNRALGVRAFNRVFDNLKKAIGILLDQDDESNKLIPGDWVFVETIINKTGKTELIVRRKRPEPTVPVQH